MKAILRGLALYCRLLLWRILPGSKRPDAPEYRIVDIDGERCFIQRLRWRPWGWGYKTLYHPETESAIIPSRKEAQWLIDIWTKEVEVARKARAAGAFWELG